MTLEEGTRELSKALQLWPYNIDAMLQLGVLLGRSKQDIQAKSQLFRILELDPRHEIVLKMMGRRAPESYHTAIVKTNSLTGRDQRTRDKRS